MFAPDTINISGIHAARKVEILKASCRMAFFRHLAAHQM
jgi:hypothetical protein